MRALLGSVLGVALYLTLASADPVHAQAPPDLLELVGGGSVRGTIVENVPGDHVTIQLVTGEIRVYGAGEVLRVSMGSAAPAPIIVAPPADPEVDLHVTASTPGLTLHRLVGTASMSVWTGRSVATATIDQFEVICGAPCDASLPPGTYTLGVSADGGTPQRAGHPAFTFTLDRDVSLEMEYESREGIRIGGWVIFGVGTATFLGLTLAPVFTGDTDTLLTYMLAGSIVYAVTLIPFFIMAFLNDHADVYEVGEGFRF